jgi:16S rRNA (uracil1498-N3)-methyltransferase
MQLFFAEHLPDQGRLTLNDEESKHCKVLRKQLGDQIQLIDGQGHLATASICQIQPKVELEVLNKTYYAPPRAYAFHLYVAPTKQNDRIEWLLEKAIEAGLDSFTLIQTERSEKHSVKLERLHKVALSAIKQSHQWHLPKIHAMQPLKSIVMPNHALVAHCETDAHKLPFLTAVNHLGSNEVNVFIGPEGDFTIGEIDWFKSKGAQFVSLGESRLRTETAGIYCAMALNAGSPFLHF